MNLKKDVGFSFFHFKSQELFLKKKQGREEKGKEREEIGEGRGEK